MNDKLGAYPDVATAPHSENSAEPYRWEPPAAYGICNRCHRYRHARVSNPALWAEFVTRVADGGYSREWATASIWRNVAYLQRLWHQGSDIRENRYMTGQQVQDGGGCYPQGAVHCAPTLNIWAPLPIARGE